MNREQRRRQERDERKARTLLAHGDPRAVRLAREAEALEIMGRLSEEGDVVCECGMPCSRGELGGETVFECGAHGPQLWLEVEADHESFVYGDEFERLH